MQFKYDEDKILNEMHDYIAKTYSEHYVSGDSKNNVQLNDLFIADGTAIPFWRNNAIKYLSRFGKKDGQNRKDLLKTIHYSILMLAEIDRKNNDSKE